MANVRKRHGADFKSRVALEALRQQRTINEMTAEYGVHATQMNNWKKQALEAIPAAFSNKREREQRHQQSEIDELHRQIGQLVAEKEWLQKKSTRLQRLSEKG